jgi:phosphoglycolate phosphatase-like HAD superfamily hydrolase
VRFPPPDPIHRAVLGRVLDRARATAGVVVFDLDSTVFDNRPRQVRIVREFGAAHGVPELTRSELAHWPHGFGFKEPFRAVGLSDERIREIGPAARKFWEERFFTSAYCVDDAVVPGAVAFVRAVWDAGATVAYVTGRPERMRAGTLEALRRHAFPVPGEGRVELLMKSVPELADDAFKEGAHADLRRLGPVIAAFDNEPTHVNAYRTGFPDALVVHLATDHSGRPVAVAEGIPAIADFEREQR